MSNQKKILLVDDEPDILEFIGYNLKKEGYEVIVARNGEEALTIAKNAMPDLIVLDVMMPGMDGMETCVELRQIPSLKHTIIVFLTARSEDYSHVAGYEAGADDYITKPVKPRVLNSKVKALFRRGAHVESASESDLGNMIEVDNLIIDRDKYNVTKDGVEIVMPKKEFEMLSLLASKPNKVFTREEIFSRVWDDKIVVGERTIDVHIRKIRERLQIENIKTVKGVGYKFEV